MKYTEDDDADYVLGYDNGAEDGFNRGFAAGVESKSEEVTRKVNEAIELIDLFYKMFPSVKDYNIVLTETQRTIADKLVRIVNIATLTERQRCLDIVEDLIDPSSDGVLLNDIEQRIKGN